MKDRFPPVIDGNALSNKKKPFLEYSPEELVSYLLAAGWPRYKIGQLRRWVFARKETQPQKMTDLSKENRAQLGDLFPLNSTSEQSLLTGELITVSDSKDGTEKLLIQWQDGHRVEAVLLRDERNHRTACISTQVGCAMKCAFCASGLDGFVRNLTRGEIVEQLLRLNMLLPPTERLTHIVVMGTGEPTLNLGALIPALEEATSPDGLDIGNRRVTISTVGRPDGILQMAKMKLPYKLAVSLHAPNDQIRNAIMPSNRASGIYTICEAADQYFNSTGRRVTYEYILLKGINDSPEQARELARLLNKKTAIVNIIPYNPVEGLPFSRPDNATVMRFVDLLEKESIQVKVRFRKGDDINAACGQLRRSFGIQKGTCH